MDKPIKKEFPPNPSNNYSIKLENNLGGFVGLDVSSLDS